MASTPSTLSGTVTQAGDKNFTFALVMLTTLFFMWGFITVLNDILIPHLKNVFELSYTQSMLVNLCFFGAYFVCSLPAGSIVKQVGYQRGIVFGLLIAAGGCLLFLPAASFESYAFFLTALFVLASGITLLQVAANPYVTQLGPEQSASQRLNMTQAFNSLGTVIGPWVGGALILSVVATGDNAADSVRLPYTALAITLASLAVLFVFLKLPKIHSEQDDSSHNYAAAIKNRHLMLGALAVFVYVGAEVSIGSFMINFFGEANIAGMEEAEAAKLVSLYWGGAMIGRFIGVALLFVVAANIMLIINALLAVGLLILVVSLDGNIAMWALIAVGLCNSLMFPTVFSLAVAKLGPLASRGSGILCMAIVGGAIVPLLQGMLADTIGLQTSFVLPIACYLYIVYYGARGYRPQ